MKLNIEKLVILLLLITGGAFLTFHYFGTKTLVIDDFSKYEYIKNTDKRDGGNSSIDILQSGDTLIYRYMIDRKDAPHQFAALRLSNVNMDLSPYDSVKIWSNTSSGNSLRMSVKNFNTSYSKIEDPDTYLFNELEYVPLKLDSSLNVGLKDFHIPSWWIGKNKASLSDVKQSFEQVIELEFSNGTYAPSLVYDTVFINKISFEGEVVSMIHFQRAIIFLWIFCAIVYVIFKQLKALKLFRKNENSLRKQNERLEQQLIIDPLTKSANRLAFEKDYKSFTDDVVIILFDIDKFKDFNDEYGHNAGDSVLISVSEFTERYVKDIGTVYRWSGGQFIIVLHKKSFNDCIDFAEKLRSAFDNSLQSGNYIATCSFGLSKKCEDDTIYTLINRADQAMHEAKDCGGNKVISK